MKLNYWLLSVFGKDRPGIIAEVTGLLFERGCNLEDVSMTILEGEFAMMMVVCLPRTKQGPVEAGLKKLEKRSRLAFYWIPLQAKPKRGEQHQKNSQSYVISAIGRDQTGIVYQMSKVLARLKLNITDLNSRILGSGKNTLYALVLETDLPEKFSAKRLQSALEPVKKKLKVDVQVRPVERLEF